MKPMKIVFCAILVATCFILSARGQSTLTNGLEAYYHFDGDVTDSSGNGKDGTNSGAIFTTDRFGNPGAAIEFTNSALVTTGFFPPLGPSSRTVSGWFKVSGVTSQETLLAYGSPNISPGGDRFELKLSNLTAEGQFALDCSFGTVWTANGYDDGNWHSFVVIVPTNAVLSKVIMYLDGVLQTNLTSDSPSLAINTIGTDALQFGQLFVSSDPRPLTGALDDVRVYNRALLAGEAAELYDIESGISNVPPVIVQPPQGETVLNQAQAIFALTVFSPSVCSYQWQMNGTNLADGAEFSGSMTNVLVVNPATTSNAGNYSVIVSNQFGSVTSSIVVLTIWTNSPVITSQPASVIVTNQAVASFMVTAAYASGYQWRDNGTNLVDHSEISGSGSNLLTLSPALVSDIGNYTVVITNQFGSVTSRVAGLTVITQTSLTNGLLAYYPFNGYVNDASGNGNNGTNFGAAFVADRFGLPNEAIYFQTNYAGTGFFPPTNRAPVTLSGWFNAAPSSSATTLLAYGGTSNGQEVQLQIKPSGEFEANFNALSLWTAGTYNDGNWHQFVVIMPTNCAVSNVVVYMDGAAATNLTQIFPASVVNVVPSRKLSFGEYSVVGNTLLPLVGTLDDVRIYNRALVDPEVQLLYALESTVPDAAPFIIQPPHNVVVTNGAATNFTVTVSGAAPFGYQWLRAGTNLMNNGDISGATNGTLTFGAAAPTDPDYYAVVITNGYGSITSSAALLIVRQAFAWSAIPSPELTQVPFTVTLQARNATNGIATNFTGTVSLSASSGIVITPTNSGTFANGIWSGKISVLGAANGLVLTATDNQGGVANAAAINVAAPPSLGFGYSGNVALVSWPDVAPATAVLQTSTNLFGTNWISVPVSPLRIGSFDVTPFEAVDPNRFYRLQFSAP